MFRWRAKNTLILNVNVFFPRIIAMIFSICFLWSFCCYKFYWLQSRGGFVVNCFLILVTCFLYSRDDFVNIHIVFMRTSTLEEALLCLCNRTTLRFDFLPLLFYVQNPEISGFSTAPVSYTHLTLPTIYSV